MPKTPDDFVFFWKPDGPNGWAGQWYPSPFTVRIALPASQDNGDGEVAEEGDERDVYFPTAEHWMMAQKALLFGDREIFERVVGLPSPSSPSSSSSTTPPATGPGPTRSTRSRPSKTVTVSPSNAKGAASTRRPPSPKEVKALGRKVKDFDDETWVRERTRIVLEGSLHKYRQNAELRRELFATGERELVEASPLDRIWGIGMGEKKGRETCINGREGWGLNLLGKALVEARAILREEFKDEVREKVQEFKDEVREKAQEAGDQGSSG